MTQPLQSLRLVDALSGATVHDFGRVDAGDTVVLALTREQAELVCDVIGRLSALEPLGRMTAGEATSARDILEQIAHERDRLAGE